MSKRVWKENASSLCMSALPLPPPQPQRWGEESQKLLIITLCLSTVHPLRAVIISVFEALMAALPVKIMGPIIFNELHQEVSMGLLSLEQRHIGKQHAFLSSKWLWVCVKLKNALFPFQPVGSERAKKGSLERNKHDSSPSALCPGQIYICGFRLIESINSAKWNLLCHWFPIYSQKYIPLGNIFW